LSTGRWRTTGTRDDLHISWPMRIAAHINASLHFTSRHFTCVSVSFILPCLSMLLPPGLTPRLLLVSLSRPWTLLYHRTVIAGIAERPKYLRGSRATTTRNRHCNTMIAIEIPLEMAREPLNGNCTAIIDHGEIQSRVSSLKTLPPTLQSHAGGHTIVPRP
jgi:hypothetical protein